MVDSWKESHDLLAEKIKEDLTNCLGTIDWTLTHSDQKVAYSEKLSTGCYELRVRKSPGPVDLVLAATFQLHPMINCCGICVSTRAEVSQDFRSRGLGTILNRLRMDIARHLGYGLLLCTDVENNEFQRKILIKNGWKDIFKFINPRTKNSIFISVINL